MFRKQGIRVLGFYLEGSWVVVNEFRGKVSITIYTPYLGDLSSGFRGSRASGF